MALKIQATATKILALLPYRIHGSTMTSGRICGWNNQTKIKKKGNLHPLLKFIGWQIASYRSMLSATRTYVDEYVTRTLFFFFLISPKNQTKQKKNKKRIRIHGRQNERSSSSAQTIMDSLYCFWTVQRIYRSSPHLREADDFAGDVSRVPGDRDFPHNVRQNANHADA